MSANSVYPLLIHTDPSGQTRKDYTPNNEIRWCPGCVDYSILASMQKLLPTLGIPRENYVFVSGIGCSSRFPYYMSTYGLHSIHGRAPTIASGLKIMRPDLTVWVITGDGDGLSIGGNHFMHALRRNMDLKILLFNNRIYGLTKGQYSPTSEQGKQTKSTPAGSIDYPVDPASIAVGSGATFVARVIGNDLPHMQEVLRRAAEHKGAAMVEIYQNCPIFNDAAFDHLTEADAKEDAQLRLQHGQPLLFGKGRQKGLILNQHGRAEVVNIADVGPDRLLVHDETSESLAYVLSRLRGPAFPTPFGVFYATLKPTYDDMARDQVKKSKVGRKLTTQEVLQSGETWTVT